ncbi:MAG TPA: pyridoxamine 5'-phosphate oxidase family protein [Spirillospora sp.]|jgi:PPOX class probable FMN-dependent enzyme|nr:pyridoxamine 5'-phosphate oxidase family protein [Spirillospora sp.]
MAEYPFAEVITSEEDLRAIIGHPSKLVQNKVNTRLDEFQRDFIAQSPFILIATANAEGSMDVSPKGDPPGFVLVLDDQTLVIPDRPGNRRADTFTNIIQNPNIGLIFLIPGNQETLRVNGKARVVRDEAISQRLSVQGKAPKLMIAVHIEEAFFHCAKCAVRSNLWEQDAWPAQEDVPSLAAALIAQQQLAISVEKLQADLDEDVKTELY